MSQDSSALFARGAAFRQLHTSGVAFVIPNPWNAGSARILEQLGFAALATTSGGLAASLGFRDGGQALISREETLDNAREIAAATTLPVAIDLENGYSDTKAGVAETIRLAADTGAVGGSIEDVTGESDDPLFPLGAAAERVSAAAEAARELPFPFVLCARAENFLYGRNDLDDTIARLRAYESAGADVLYAPKLPDIAAVRAVCKAVSKPVNVLVTNPEWTVDELAAAGVTRISLGSHLSNTAFGAALSAAREVRESGTFTFTSSSDAAAISEMMRPRR